MALRGQYPKYLLFYLVDHQEVHQNYLTFRASLLLLGTLRNIHKRFVTLQFPCMFVCEF